MLIIVDEEALTEVTKLIGGELAVKVVQLLQKKPLLSDEEIAEHLGVDVRDMRRIIQKLSDNSLLSYETARDKETGHRVFKWRVQQSQVVGFIKTEMKKILERLKQRLKYEQDHQFFYCGTDGHMKYTFEEAMERMFKCNLCGKQLDHYDNSKLIEAIKEKISQLERQLSVL